MAPSSPVPPKLPLEPLPRRKPRITTLRGGVVLMLGAVLLVVLLGGLLLTTSRQQAQQRKAQEPQAAPALPTLPSQALAGLPATYAQALTPPPATPRAVPTAPPTQGPPDFRPPAPPRSLPPPPMASGQALRPVSAAPVEERKPRRWYTAETAQQGDLMASPFPETPETGAGARRQSQLFPSGTWERPQDPTRTIYASQLLHGLLEQAVVTGESSTVRIRLTQTLYDKFGRQHPLLPVDTILLGTVEGGVKFGQTRVGIGLTKAELPDGTDLLLQGKAGDAGGAVGIRGKVDNKYGQVALAAILTAALSVGARSAVGTPSGFYENPAQEFGRDVSQSLNQSGQDLVRRSLSVQPEISLPIHTPVTVQLSQNISLQSQPVIVHK